jgi:hypothetical protein
METIRCVKLFTFSVSGYEKEEAWLNEMSARGWQLASVVFCSYRFTKDNSNVYQYRLEYLKNGVYSPLGSDYIGFLEGSGIEHICQFGNWAYFRKQASEEQFELFSDADSKMAHYMRILRVNIVILLSMSIIVIVNFLNFQDDNDVGTVGFIFPAIAFTIWLVLIIKTLRQVSILKKKRVVQE